ncbi:MAG: Rrf2 family transcriptional regulator [Gammaproteobacteria bacterium]|jgi:Rrf2 family nitric oxide-sensitive transcriptional repressor
MRLTTFTDYSLRVLIYLGTRSDRRAVVGEIAAAYGISKNHLLKVILFLAEQGYVVTTRGKGGGVQLQLDPGRIRIGDVVRRSEAGSVLVECFSPGTSDCRIERSCLLRGAFSKALQAFYAVLDTYTLADLLDNQPQLKSMLRTAAKPERAGRGG